ncbi:MAG: hypothetical protein ACYSWQ_27565 [Planctomycetota bacterium]
MIVADPSDNSALINYDNNVVRAITAQCAPDQALDLARPANSPATME